MRQGLQQDAVSCSSLVSRTTIIVISAVALSAVGFCVASENSIRIAETEQGYQFYDVDVPVLFYRTSPKATEKGTHSRANYCHPLYGFDGRILTEDFPSDHLHHRGVFWAWHQVYVGEVAVGDMWACTDFTWDIRDVRILRPQRDSAALKASVHWRSPQWKDGLAPLAQETVTIRVHKIVDDARAIDFAIEILAFEEGLRIGGSNDVKGYGGFSTRIVLPPDIRMNDPNGPVTPQNTAVAAGDWMNFSGTFGETTSNMAIFIHPSNPGHPRQWILRSAGSAQNVAYPGREPIPISTKEPLVLNYRLVLHRHADLDRLFSAYRSTKTPDVP